MAKLQSEYSTLELGFILQKTTHNRFLFVKQAYKKKPFNCLI
jgi:hypothetical protein